MKLIRIAEKVNRRLREILHSIHECWVECVKQEDEFVHYLKVAKVVGFLKVAKSKLEQGIVLFLLPT